jgi:NAD(P)-dependent dehydrogenase (short-subunit alcohol dehydrogenase family)
METQRVALVTGAGRGIGAAVALRLAQAGAKVALVSRTEAQLQETKEAIQRATGRSDLAFSFPGDLGELGFVESMISEVWQKLGPVTWLVNNAAVARLEPVTGVEAVSLDETWRVNVRAPFLLSRDLLRKYRETGTRGGAIVNIASLGGLSGTAKFKGLSAYGMSKFAVVGMTESMAVEGRELGIRVNCVAPGAVDTEMLRKAAPHLKTETMPADVAEVIYSLCDDVRSACVTGATLPIHSNL